jgi:hypothetical protein
MWNHLRATARSCVTGERRNPLSYHNGSIWPHDNSLIASGLAKYGFKKRAGQMFMALLDLSSLVELHRLPELFCGVDRRLGEGPTLYPVACSPGMGCSCSLLNSAGVPWHFNQCRTQTYRFR